jgi:hypothetical protein
MRIDLEPAEMEAICLALNARLDDLLRSNISNLQAVEPDVITTINLRDRFRKKLRALQEATT